MWKVEVSICLKVITVVALTWESEGKNWKLKEAKLWMENHTQNYYVQCEETLVPEIKNYDKLV
jgi:hypothetical protein